MNFTIETIHRDTPLYKELAHKIDTKTKPIGALGILEEIALQIGLIQQTTTPKINKPSLVVFAGDHGIAQKGEVNPYPQEVTTQMVYNFIQGGAAINTFCNLNAITLNIVDAGVNHDFESIPQLINAKVAKGTHNYQEQAAMSLEQCKTAINKGAEICLQHYTQGCNTIGFGEMGIGNTSAAALLMAAFTGTSIEDCVGAGTGLVPKAIQKKQQILSEVYHQYTLETPLEKLATFGGFEIAMITGAMLKAAELRMTILVDGFIVTAALLAAHDISPQILDYCVFAHSSGEQGHQKMLNFLNRKPLLNLGLRLGEGTGAALAFPLLQASVSFLNEMASFEQAGVSEKA